MTDAFVELARPGRGRGPRHHHKIQLDAFTPGTDEAKIADLYASFMDEAAIEAAGAEPLSPPLSVAIDAV